MSKEGKQRRLSKVEWRNARVKYESGMSYGAVARYYNISHQAVLQRSKKEGWIQDNVELMRRKVVENVAGVIKGATTEKRDKALDDEADRITEVIKRHRKEWTQVAGLRQESVVMRHPDDGSAKAADKTRAVAAASASAKFTKIIAEVTALQQAGERKAWGLDVESNTQVDSLKIQVVRECKAV